MPRSNGYADEHVLNQARRQTIAAFRERGAWKIGDLR
jgi:hypothetical protein